MPWMTNKGMTLLGVEYPRGAVVPQATVESIRPGRLGTLERLNMLQRVEVEHAEARLAEVAVADAPAVEGDMCPQCGTGPFKRLAQHVSQMHEGA